MALAAAVAARSERMLAAYVIAIESAGENPRLSVRFNSRRDKFRQPSTRLPAELRKELLPAREGGGSAAIASSGDDRNKKVSTT